MKLSPYVKNVKQAYESNKLLLDDVLQLYKDNYLNEIECRQVIEGGIKNGRIRQLQSR